MQNKEVTVCKAGWLIRTLQIHQEIQLKKGPQRSLSAISVKVRNGRFFLFLQNYSDL